MNKEMYIETYGQAAFDKMRQQGRVYYDQHRAEAKVRSRAWYVLHSEEVKDRSKERHANHREEDNAKMRERRENHPNEMKDWRAANRDKVVAYNQEGSCKGGKYYKAKLEYQRTGLQQQRRKIRWHHWHLYRHIKKAIAPNSVFHHEWIPGTADYRGVALVDKGLHRRGIIKVIKLLEGQITLFTEKEIKEQEE